MIRTKIHVQNLAYCRYIYIWTILFLLNIVPYSPLASLFLISILELKSHVLSNKNYITFSKAFGLIFVDILLFILVFMKDTNLYIVPNILFFVFYLLILHIHETNILTLHNELLKQDDLNHSQEKYFEYMKRIWGLAIQ